MHKLIMHRVYLGTRIMQTNNKEAYNVENNQNQNYANNQNTNNTDKYTYSTSDLEKIMG